MENSSSTSQGAVKCVKCGSPDVMYSKKRRVYICEDCAQEFTLEEKRPAWRIFISHMPGEPAAERLRTDLSAAGYELWPNPKPTDDPAGSRAQGLDWVAETGRNGRFIVLMSPESIRRPDGHCLGDVALAVQKKLPIIPVMLARCDMPLSICRIQRIDLMDCFPVEDHREKYDKRLKLIVETIEEEGLDYKNVQSRLLHVLEPLPFDVDIQRHLARFTGRQWIFKRVDKWLVDPSASRIFWIIGAPGVGKTAIASWLAFNRPEVAAFHLCRYGDAEKSDPRRAILSIAYQLSTQLADYQERLNGLNLEKIARESNAKTLFDSLIIQPLSGNFPEPGGAIVILIDALDEATRSGKNELAELIASEFGRAPRWLRLVITSRPEPEILHPLQGLTPYILDTADPENEQDIREYLARELKPYTAEKEVPARAIDTIASMSEGIFLYVEWIRQELAQGRLSLGRLDEFPRGLTGVYSQFFTRQYPVMEKYRSKISPALEIVVAALEPLKIQMIGSIFRWDEYEQADFSQEIGALFPIQDEKVQPFHRSVIDWLTDTARASNYFIDARNGHRRLADCGWEEYGRGIGSMADYMLAHLPAHLINDERWDQAVAMLGDLRYFDIAWGRNEFTVQNYWSQIEARSGILLVDSYRPIIVSPSKYDGQSLGVANLLYSTSHFAEAETLFDYLAGYFRSTNDLKKLKNSIDKKGMILAHKGDNIEALKTFKEEERICLELGDRFGLEDCLAMEIYPLLNMGDLDGINRVIEEMDRNSLSMNKRQISLILHAKGLVLAETGRLDEALKVYREKEKICLELKNADCLYHTLNNMALILYEKGDYDEALEINKRLEKLCLDHSNLLMLTYCLLNFVFIYYDIGEKDKALETLKRVEELGRKLDHKLTITNCLGTLSIIRHDMGDLDAAMGLLEEEMAICNDQNDKLNLQYVLGNMALIHYDRGRLDEAMRMMEEKRKLASGSSITRSVQAAMGNQALILADRDELDAALKLHQEEEKICRQLGNKKELAICLFNQANLLYARGLKDDAMRLYGETESQFRHLKYRIGLQGCLNGEAIILYEQGNREEAMKYLDEAEDICRAMDYKKGLEATLINKAVILHDREDVAGASKLLEEAEGICRGMGYKEGLAIALIDRAVIAAYDNGDRTAAIKLSREASEITRNCGIHALAKKLAHLHRSIEETTAGTTVVHDGGEGKKAAQAPGLIMQFVKRQKQDKNI
ncbi:MAG TPA: tetratricopeptide repeat protein [Methanocella sp.]|uniref:tetratricopeptide repeat protein n=1 Tax=Methanocella sp. TaxID=2052833 RepID=UPI002C01599C|nr:tetratricopeptide repeat protein [Methanocella sp.]HTY90351.1 tetratricopeptide repeat protein [Methanocella sp.]